MLAEQQTEWIISNNLVNKGWHIDNDVKKNVYFQKPKLKTEQTKLKGKRPDYILYESNTDRPIAIIEAKKAGKGLTQALEQAAEYAKLLDIPIVFAMNGAYCEARFVANNKELILNGDEVKELLREKELLAFIDVNSHEAWTIPKEVKVSREELISVFKNLNNLLRSEGLRAGIERFSEFANILFLKLLSENNEKSWWNSIKAQSDDDIIGYINGHVIEQIKNKYGGDVFTPISLSNSSTLRHIINIIDPLILSSTNIKDNAFEYFLEKTRSTCDYLGEYFTPKNIIKLTINYVDPKFGETVYDPFCGSGGFLTEAFKYIKENNILSKARLQAVILLPYFLPYTRVKPSILYFTDAHKPNYQRYYWFYEKKILVPPQTTKKRKNNSSNFKKVVENSKIDMFEFSFERIDLKEVKNNNYNLVGSAYRDTKNIIPTNQKDCYRKNHTTW
ncbi:N-6 DNA methylase [Rickettsia endosymbiont of Seladonia tumulorum]|uniref:N-6 DNA methylase n=1 Tax=Rickettsia endosymbiont of Seladonia tumulorum TaxID=3066270 RepID=UPI00313EBE6E